MIIPIELYPVALVQDRYGGVYSGGEWLAVAEANVVLERRTRVEGILGSGPHGGDIEAKTFWSAPPRWIAADRTPDAALIALLQKNGYDDEAIARLVRGPFGSLSNAGG